jgi:hypothetical protein
MLWSALLNSMRLPGKNSNRVARKSRYKPSKPCRSIPRLENLENRLAPAVAASDLSALVDLTPAPPTVVAGVKPTVVTKTAAGFTASIELMGTVSESNGTSTKSAKFDVKKTVNLALVKGGADTRFEHSDDFTLKVGSSQLVAAFDLLGQVDITTASNGDEVVDLRFTETAHLKQTGSPGTAAVNFQGVIGLFTAATSASAKPLASAGTPLASLQATEVASLQTVGGDSTVSLALNDGAHEKWDVANQNGTLHEHDTTNLVEGARKIGAAGPVSVQYDGNKGSTAPTTMTLDSASLLHLTATSDSADNKLKLDGSGYFANLKVHGTTKLTDNQGEADTNDQLGVTGNVNNFDVQREQTLVWNGSGGDTAMDHEHVSILATPTTTSGASPGIVAAATTGLQASLASDFNLATAGNAYDLTHQLNQSGPPILFDFTDTLPPSTTTGGGGAGAG